MRGYISELDKQCIGEMIDWCFQHDVEYFTDLMEYAKKHRIDWHQVLYTPIGAQKMSDFLSSHSDR